QRQRRDARRHSRHQWFNSFGIAFGVLFTAASLISTWLTLQATKEGQITDRYTKAIEQLGSPKPEVRIGGIYALERLMVDSDRDRFTVMPVLAAYVRSHAQDKPPVGSDQSRLAVDVEAALKALSSSGYYWDLSINLRNVDLHGKNLRGTLLYRANLAEANLRKTSLNLADLRRAEMGGADLREAKMYGAILRQASLAGVDLRGADLRGADLFKTNLSQVKWNNADLRGADLRQARGVRAEQVRRVARTDRHTRF
ncbi:pentapeptide repeat-containing protein, partial [Actinomadura kijaniata]